MRLRSLRGLGAARQMRRLPWATALLDSYLRFGGRYRSMAVQGAEACSGCTGRPRVRRRRRCVELRFEAALVLEWAKTGEGPLPEVITTDSFERGLRSADPLDPVMNCDVETALARFKPHVVIVGFMPLGVDWTAAFRACPSVRSYLLLGEIDDGCCGRPWQTWGYMCDGDDDACDVEVSSTSGSDDDDDDDDDESMMNGDAPRIKSVERPSARSSGGL